MSEFTVRTGLVLLAALLAPAIGPAQPASTPASAQPAARATTRTEYWAGSIEQINPTDPAIVVLITLVFDPAAGVWTATLDVPPAAGLTGAVALPFSEATVTDTSIRLVMTTPQGQNAFDLTREAGKDTAAGHFIVNSAEGFAVTARRISEPEAGALIVRRPQTPRPPFPYRSQPASFVNPSDNVTIAGTLTIPAGAGPFPAAVLVNDFGPHDRDRSDSLHKLFLVIADRLARDGVAVLRTDDRGVGESQGDYNSTPLGLFVVDVRAAVTGLAQQDGIDPKRIGLIGCGEGAAVAAAAATRDDNGPTVAFLALLAPQGIPGADMLAMQMRRQLEAQGEVPAEVAKRSEARRTLLRLIGSGADEAACLKAILDAVNADIASHRGEWANVLEPQANFVAQDFYLGTTRPRIRAWLSADPAGVLRSVRCPALVLGGDLDLIATAADNIPPVEQALRAAPGADVTVKILPRLNHQLQPAATGMPDEPVQIRTTIAPAALDLLSRWIRDKSKPSP